jgi:hypothetical protein
MGESNEPQDRPEGKTPYRPVPAEVEDIPLADVEIPPDPRVDPVAPEAPPPEPPDEPIDEGAITLD